MHSANAAATRNGIYIIRLGTSLHSQMNFASVAPHAVTSHVMLCGAATLMISARFPATLKLRIVAARKMTGFTMRL
jgi:hypothetical protein